MEKIKPPVIEFVKPILIINVLALITSFAYGYIYYFANKGKGIDDLLFEFSLYSLSSFFAAIAALKYVKNKQQVILWLVLGLIYVLLSAGYIYLEIANRSGLLIICIEALIPLTFFIIALVAINRLKIFRICLYCLFVLSLVSCAIPVFLFFIVGALAWIWSLFYKG